MPAFVLPQLLLCGLFVAARQMAALLRWLSDVLPMTYAYDALASRRRPGSSPRHVPREMWRWWWL